MRDQNPRSASETTMTKAIVAKATHWSWGQYVWAATGARLNPISSTTAPVTAGGSTRFTTTGPACWMTRPTMASTTPDTRIAPTTSPESPPPARTAATPPTKAAEVPR